MWPGGNHRGMSNGLLDITPLVIMGVLLLLVVYKEIMSSRLNEAANNTDGHPPNCEES